ncbi:MAG: SdiA-regulated domain-containing protein [Sulfurovaceae bacterium]|nr:SdiA-regulated domain-containing protein [Sulfurovaceae bacterium]
MRQTEPTVLTVLKFSILFFLLLSSFSNAEKISSKHKISNIEEASGVSYCTDTNTYMVANDEGSFYEISPEGKTLSRHKLGDYDLEGVVCQKEELIFAIEKGALLIVNRETLKTKYLKVKSKKFNLSKKAGIEGIAKVEELYYLAIQAKKKKDARILIVKITDNHAKVIDSIKHDILDTSGLDYHDEKLYIISDKNDKLYIYNLKKNKMKKKSYNLPKFAQEGIAFDNNGSLLLADDNGAVFKYTKEELKLK